MSMPSDDLMPDPAADYQAPARMKLSRAVWNFVFGSLGSRVRLLEGRDLDYQEVVNLLKTQALLVISESISSEITARRADLLALQAQFQAVSDAYIELVSGGVYADGIQMRTPLTGTVQAAIVAMQAQLANQRKITVASLYFGAS